MSLAIIALVALLSTYIAGKAAYGATHARWRVHILDQQGQPSGACPLKHTEVEASIQGFSTRTRAAGVSQPLATKIEAVYVFPLPQNAAVDTMTMTVGKDGSLGTSNHGMKPGRSMKQPALLATWPACWIRNGRIFLLSRWPMSSQG